MVIIMFHIQISKRKEEIKRVTKQNEGKNVKRPVLRILKVVPKLGFTLFCRGTFFVRFTLRPVLGAATCDCWHRFVSATNLQQNSNLECKNNIFFFLLLFTTRDPT